MKGPNARGVWTALRNAGPYVLMELLLPGGTLLALLMWLSSGAPRGHFAESHSTGRSPAEIVRVVAVQRGAFVAPRGKTVEFLGQAQ